MNLGSFFFPERFARAEKRQRIQQQNAFDYSDMALRIASANDLEQTLSILMTEIALNRTFAKLFENHDRLYLLTAPAHQTATTHASSVSFSKRDARFLNTLSHYPVKATSLYNLDTFDGRHYLLMPLKQEQHFLGTLVMAFKDKIQNPDRIFGQTNQLRKALSKGLGLQLKAHLKVEAAIQEERSAHAADLHDSIAQVLSYLKLKTTSLSSGHANLTPDQIEHLTQDIDTQVAYAHRLTRELIASSRIASNGTDLSQAIQTAMEEFEQLSGIVFELDNRCQPQLKNLPHPTEVLFILREALCNVVRHSHATHARIIISQSTASDQLLNLVVEDNGIGLSNSAKRHDSFGLHIMQERAKRVRGELNISPRPGGGTRVALTLRATA